MSLQSLSDRFLSLFSIKPVTGGLEITDQVMRLGIFEGASWQFYAVRMEPGILEGGRIKDRPRFLEYLAALRAKVFGRAEAKKKIYATVALGETAMFNQIFSLPLVAGENLGHAAQLNLQMSSPMDFSQVYSGWQVVKQDENLGRVELLGAFADRALIDQMVEALFEAGYVAIAVESKALALARLFRDQGRNIDMGVAYILVGADDAGLDFLIIRNGQLYFEYANVWRDLADDKGLISAERFQEALETSLRQVMNFYLQHWEGKVEGVVIASGVFVPEIERAAGEALSLPAYSLAGMTGGLIAPEWFVSFGTGLRSLYDRHKDREITLLGEGAKATYEKDRVISFAEFWRIFMPVMFGALLILFGLAYFFLDNINKGLPPAPSVAETSPQEQAIGTLQEQANAFNRAISLVSSIEENGKSRSAILAALTQAAAENNVVIARISLPSVSAPLYLSGTAPSSSEILAFKAAVASSSEFDSVDVPLSQILGAGGTYSFTMTAKVRQQQQ